MVSKPPIYTAYDLLRTEGATEVLERGRSRIANPISERYVSLKYGIRNSFYGIKDQQRLISNFIEKDEFVLIILDACRFDYFCDEYSEYLSGPLSKAWSPASLTPKWVTAVWSGDVDLTYVSANPYVGDFEVDARGKPYIATEHISDVICSWKTSWDSAQGTVLAEDITDDALRAARREDETRLVVHYLQPHAPYVGEQSIPKWGFDPSQVSVTDNHDVSQEERQEVLKNRSVLTPEECIKYGISNGDRKRHDVGVKGEFSPQRKIEEGIMTVQEWREAYRSNLRYALAEVRRLVTRLDVPAVVTADHGELLGEGGMMGHPDEAHPLLRDVPWLVVDEELSGTEASSTAERRGEEIDIDDSVVQDRLSQLGYTE